MSETPDYYLAQLNIAAMKAPLDSPLLSDFVASLDRINAMAEQAPGFVWRLQTDDGDATALRPLGEEILVNLSVWKSVQTLSDFVYRSGHVEIMKRRREWFERMDQAHVVLWWVARTHRPDIAEAAERLKQLHSNGPTPLAFGFRDSFPAPKQP
ncbi:MAG: DUF3291 domain-containing protein [Burkholderiaceae bacterium]